MKKVISASVLAASVLLPTHTLAAEIPTNAVTLKVSDVRRGASNYYEVVATLQKNHSTTILDEYTNSLGETWYRVALNDIKGWVPAESFYKEYDLKKLVGAQAVFTYDKVNVRKDAGTEFGIVSQSLISDKVSVVDVEKNSKNEVWYKIFSSKHQGWVIQDYLVKDTPAVNGTTVINGSAFIGSTLKLSNSAANMRSGATTSYKIIETVPSGTSMKILGSFTNSNKEVWFNVEYNGSRGWILSELFILTTTTPASGTGTTKVALVSGKVHSGATASYKVVANVQSGSSYLTHQQFTNSLGESWTQITYASGKKGWVRSETFVVSNVGAETGTKKTALVSENVHSGATTRYKVVSTLKAGTSYLTHQEFTNSSGEKWIQVTYSTGNKGWVLSKAFEAIPKKVVKTESMIHSGATTNYKVVASVKIGSILPVHQEFTNSLGEKWFQVTYSTGNKGWVLSKAFEDTPTKTVTKESSVHSGATTSYKTVASIKAGIALPIHQEFINGSNQKWYQVTYATSSKGWIQATAFGEAPLPTLPGTPIIEENKLRISAPVANMRKGPSIEYPILKQLNQDEQLISKEFALDSLGKKWFSVVLSTGDKGWLHESVVSLNEEPAEVTTNTIQTFNTTVYSSQSFGANILTTLKRLETIKVLNKVTTSDSLNWLQIQTSTGIIGWIPEFEVTSNLPVKYAIKNSSVYSGASTSYKVKETVIAGSSMRVLRTLNGWYNVETQNAERGWIQSTLVANTSPIQLSNGRTEIINGDNYLVWTKPSDFKVSYSKPAANVLRVSGNLSSVSQIQNSLPGVQSIKVEKAANGTSVLLITFSSNYTYTIRDYNNRLTIKVLGKGLYGKKIIIDAGHGAHDPGAIGPAGTTEKYVNLRTALLLKSELEAAGAKVLLTRSTDVFLELSDRTSISNSSDYDAFVSIHADSYTSTSRGSTTFYNSSVNFNGPQSYALATSIQSQLVLQTGTYNRGVKAELFYVNRMNELPSVLVELAFLSNPTEEALLATEAFRKKAAVGIKNGLNNYFNK